MSFFSCIGILIVKIRRSNVRLIFTMWIPTYRKTSLQWRHHGRDGVSDHQPHDCLLNRLFRRRSKKTSKLRVTGLCEGNSPVICEFPAQRASNTEKFPFDDVIMSRLKGTGEWVAPCLCACSRIDEKVTHLLGHHWFRSWFVAYMAPSPYLGQWWLIVNVTPGNTSIFMHLNICIVR